MGDAGGDQRGTCMEGLMPLCAGGAVCRWGDRSGVGALAWGMAGRPKLMSDCGVDGTCGSAHGVPLPWGDGMAAACMEWYCGGGAFICPAPLPAGP